MVNQKTFPPNFTWGAATSVYQIEGAWNEGGKGPHIWDEFAHTPGKVARGENGDRACDHYHRFREDVALMAGMGLKAYRFSIAWSRIQPTGTGEVNQAGIDFYSDLIDELLHHGIIPWITLHHWDLPAALQHTNGGWRSKQTCTDFADYARICFRHFGDRVTHWITMNESWVMAILGYHDGVFAPGRRPALTGVLPWVVHRPILPGRLPRRNARAGGGAATRLYGRRETAGEGQFRLLRAQPLQYDVRQPRTRRGDRRYAMAHGAVEPARTAAVDQRPVR